MTHFIKNLLFIIPYVLFIALLSPLHPFPSLSLASEPEVQQEPAPQKYVGSTLISDEWRLFLTHEMFMRRQDGAMALWNSDLTIWITQFNIKESKVSLLADIRKRIPEGSKITIDENNNFYHLLAFEQPETSPPEKDHQPLVIIGHGVSDSSFVILELTCKSAETAPAAYKLLRSLEHKIQ